MKIVIKKQGKCFYVDPTDKPGSTRVGMGGTMDAAIADFVRIYQGELGLEITVDESAQPAELGRRRREFKKR